MKNNEKKHLRRLLYIGMATLGITALVSFIGMILSLFKIGDYINVASSVFVASVSSILTIVALLFTVEFNNRQMSAQSQKSLNDLRYSLSLEKVEINKYLQPKTITRKNKNIDNDKRNNMRIVLHFKTKDISELSNIALRKFCLESLYECNNKNKLYIKLTDDNVLLSPIESNGNNEFLYEIITNVAEQPYKHFLWEMKKYGKQKISVKIGLVVQNNYQELAEWNRSKKKELIFQSNNCDPDQEIFVFEKLL